MNWNDSYSVGSSEIDGQHKRLFGIIDELLKAGSEPGAPEATAELFVKLEAYSVIHFQTEEKYFDAFHYPEADEHKKMHQGYVDKVAAMRGRFRSGETVDVGEVVIFLARWWATHIMEADKRYAAFFKANGVK